MSTIKIARRLFANTPVQKSPLTTYIYRKVFRYGYGADELTIDFRGVKLTIPTKDATIVPGLVGGFYEEMELDVYERLSKISKTILDVGGSVGDYTCVGARNLPTDGRIVVFEPISENINYIRKNVVQNGYQNKVTIEHAGAGEKDGEITIYLAEGSVGTHSASKTTAEITGGGVKSVKVPMMSLDSYVTKNNLTVDILKVDVEGYDGFVLRGAKWLLSKQKPTLFIEFVADHLKNCDFPPGEFIQILMARYEHIYLVNEPKKTLKRCTKADLERLGANSINANLILTDNKDHLAAIDEWLKSRQ